MGDFVPHPPSLLDANAMCKGTATVDRQMCSAVMMTWGGVDDGIDVLGLALFAGGPCSCCKVKAWKTVIRR